VCLCCGHTGWTYPGIRQSAEGGNIAGAQIAPIGKYRRKSNSGLTRSELKEPVARTTSESISQPLTDLRIKSRCVLLVN